MKIDTRIRHVTRPGANIYSDLGFSARAAKTFQAATKKIIQHKLGLKTQLMTEIEGWMEEHHYKQLEAAHILGISRPRVSDIVNQRAEKFSIDMLVDLVTRTGCDIQVKVKKAA